MSAIERLHRNPPAPVEVSGWMAAFRASPGSNAPVAATRRLAELARLTGGRHSAARQRAGSQAGHVILSRCLSEGATPSLASRTRHRPPEAPAQRIVSHFEISGILCSGAARLWPALAAVADRTRAARQALAGSRAGDALPLAADGVRAGPSAPGRRSARPGARWTSCPPARGSSSGGIVLVTQV